MSIVEGMLIPKNFKVYAQSSLRGIVSSQIATILIKNKNIKREIVTKLELSIFNSSIRSCKKNLYPSRGNIPHSQTYTNPTRGELCQISNKTIPS